MGESGVEQDGDDDPFKEIDDAALAAMDMPDLPQPHPFMGFGDDAEADLLGGGFELPMPPQEFQMGPDDDNEGLVLPMPPPEFL